MSSQQGYGRISTKNLIYYYDLSDTYNCYLGEPTTNILPDAANNGRFTTNNQWGTYNTNQYNGGSYFSIGGIFAVISNIVNTSSPHPFRTFDAVTPQTTGGGVTAGVNYFINKIDDTSFTLHEYNDSQDGSQGYINPSTGYHKVHDSIALDQRISITSSGFPNMWWGPPHLPNTSHVKEIVSNGGYVKDTNCMRINVIRTVGVNGGMAYGVNTPVTINDLITVSFWCKSPTLNGVGATLQYQTYFGGGVEGNGSYVLTQNWARVVFQWTSSVTYSFYQYFFPVGYTSPYSVDIADLQVEVNKGHATPFTTGTRTVNQGLLELSGTKLPINLSNVSFDSNSNIMFDGTNDNIETSVEMNSELPYEKTYSCVVKCLDNINTWNVIMGGPWFPFIGFYLGQYITIHYGDDTFYSNDVLSLDTWYYVACTFVYDGIKTIMEIYINGNLSNSRTFVGNIGYNSGNVTIGDGVVSGWIPFYGYINDIGLYNKSLSKSEITQNYNHYKTKYNLA